MVAGQQIDDLIATLERSVESGLAYFQPGGQSKVMIGPGDRVRSYAIWCGGIKPQSKVWNPLQKTGHRTVLMLQLII